MKNLFETTIINQMELKNRFVRSATWEGLANPDGSCSEELTDLMVNLAKGQVGLIISGHAYINSEGFSSVRQLGIHDDRLITSYKKMVEKVHAEGSKIFMQITHSGAKSWIGLAEKKPFGPSFLKVKDILNCREITLSEVSQIIEDFKNAALRAKKAGFDGVQIHAAHGYLLSEFLSPFFNKRKDKYGGCLENRARLVLEIYRAIRSAVGIEFTVIIKINSEDFIKEEFMVQGFTLSEMLQVAAMLEVEGIDAIELSGSLSLPISKYLSFRTEKINSREKEVYYREAAELYKGKIAVPLILVGGIRSYEVAKELVEEEQADYISLCRPLIREPELIKRWYSGDIKRATCVSCGKCFTQAKTGKGMRCVLEN